MTSKKRISLIFRKKETHQFLSFFVSLSSPTHPILHTVVHPYFAAPGLVCERPKSLVVRGASWASFRRRGWRLLRLRGVVRRGLRMGSVGRPGRRQSEGLGGGRWVWDDWSIYLYIGRTVRVGDGLGGRRGRRLGSCLGRRDRRRGYRCIWIWVWVWGVAWASGVWLGVGVKKKI